MLVIALAGASVLSGCGEKEMASCAASAEQLVLLRQMAAVGATKTAFDQCIVAFKREKYCRAVWLDTDGEVRNCMESHGLRFVEGPSGAGCHFLDYDEISCYRPKWLLALPPEIQNLLIPPRT